MLSQPLCVAFKNQFDPGKPTFPFLAELISCDQISYALGGKPGSVFLRHGVAIHKLVAADNPSLSGWGFAETEPVVHLVNDYDRDLFNGSLGRIRRIVTEDSEGAPLGRSIECDFDGVLHKFTEDSLDRIELAHAITVHKAQGSQFQRVVIPLVWSRLLDRTLIYTALTRAVDQVVLVGDRQALAQAIKAPPHSQQRKVGFRL